MQATLLFFLIQLNNVQNETVFKQCSHHDYDYWCGPTNVHEKQPSRYAATTDLVQSRVFDRNTTYCNLKQYAAAKSCSTSGSSSNNRILWHFQVQTSGVCLAQRIFPLSKYIFYKNNIFKNSSIMCQTINIKYTLYCVVLGVFNNSWKFGYHMTTLPRVTSKPTLDIPASFCNFWWRLIVMHDSPVPFEQRAWKSIMVKFFCENTWTWGIIAVLLLAHSARYLQYKHYCILYYTKDGA